MQDTPPRRRPACPPSRPLRSRPGRGIAPGGIRPRERNGGAADRRHLYRKKPGQFKLDEALKLKKKTNKKAYIFLADNITEEELENFNLPIYINTACPRIDSGKVIYYKLI